MVKGPGRVWQVTPDGILERRQEGPGDAFHCHLLHDLEAPFELGRAGRGLGIVFLLDAKPRLVDDQVDILRKPLDQAPGLGKGG
jgi:hypothetical protein